MGHLFLWKNLMGAICRGKTERERKNNVRDARMLCVLGFKILIMEWRRVLLLLREREWHERDGSLSR